MKALKKCFYDNNFKCMMVILFCVVVALITTIYCCVVDYNNACYCEAIWEAILLGAEFGNMGFMLFAIATRYFEVRKEVKND